MSLNADLDEVIDKAINNKWADFYACRMVRHNTEMNRLYGLHLTTDYQEIFTEYLEILTNKK